MLMKQKRRSYIVRFSIENTELMKPYCYLFIFCTAFACNRTESTSTEANNANSKVIAQTDPKVLESLANALWKEAYVNRDANLASELFGEHFILVDDEGSVFSKGDELAYIAEYGDQYKNFSFTIEQIYFSANTTGILIAACKFRGDDSTGLFETTYRQSLICSNLDTNWKVVYSHVSGVEETRL